jgi:hypothetical protein
LIVNTKQALTADQHSFFSAHAAAQQAIAEHMKGKYAPQGLHVFLSRDWLPVIMLSSLQWGNCKISHDAAIAAMENLISSAVIGYMYADMDILEQGLRSVSDDEQYVCAALALAKSIANSRAEAKRHIRENLPDPNTIEVEELALIEIDAAAEPGRPVLRISVDGPPSVVGIKVGVADWREVAVFESAHDPGEDFALRRIAAPAFVFFYVADRPFGRRGPAVRRTDCFQ